MGKRSNHKRTLRHHARRDREAAARIADLKQQVQLHAAGMDSAQKRAERAEDQLRRMIKLIAAIDPCSAALENDMHKIPYGGRNLRWPVRNKDEARSLLYSEAARSCAQAQIEEVMQILVYERDVQQQMARALHFRIDNAPNVPDFTVGYAVTHTMVKCLRHPEQLTEMICRQMGHAIHAKLFPR